MDQARFETAIKTLETVITLLLVRDDKEFLIVQSAGNGLDNGGGDIGVDSRNNGSMSTIDESLFNLLSEELRENLAKAGITYHTIDDHIIIVGAVTNNRNDSQYKLRPSSNYGDNVDICAPGEEIVSTVTEHDDTDPKRTAPELDGLIYGEMSGTSMAAPMVSAAAALVWQVNPDLTAAEVKEILVSCNPEGAIGVSADDKDAEGNQRVYPMLNVGKAVEMAAAKKEASSEPASLEGADSQVQYRLIRKTHFNGDSGTPESYTEYHYNQAGQLADQVVTVSGGSEITTEYSYDNSGRLDSSHLRMLYGENYLTRYHYNNSGEKTDEITYCAGVEDPSMVEFWHEYRYENGKLAQDDYHVGAGVTSSEYIYEGDLISKVYESNQNPYSGYTFNGTYEYAYDGNDRLVEKRFIPASKDRYSSTIVYIYDENSNLTEELRHDYYTYGESETRDIYEYEVVTGAQEQTEITPTTDEMLTEDDLLAILKREARGSIEDHIFLDMNHDGAKELIAVFSNGANLDIWFCSSDGVATSCANCGSLFYWGMNLLNYRNETHVAINCSAGQVSGAHCWIVGLSEERGPVITELSGAAAQEEDGTIRIAGTESPMCYYDASLGLAMGRAQSVSYAFYDNGIYYEYIANEISEADFLRFGNSQALKELIISERSNSSISNIELSYYIRNNGIIHVGCEEHEYSGNIGDGYYTVKYYFPNQLDYTAVLS